MPQIGMEKSETGGGTDFERKITLSEAGRKWKVEVDVYVSRGRGHKVKCDGLNLLEVECKTPAENRGSGRVK